MDGYYSAALLARICTFCEIICDAEVTQITRGGDAALDCFECEVFTKRNHFTLKSAASLVRLYVQELDSHAVEPVLLAEVEAGDEHAIEELRACVAGVEALSEMKARKDRTSRVEQADRRVARFSARSAPTPLAVIREEKRVANPEIRDAPEANR